MQQQTLTVKDKPQHHVIGRFFFAWDGHVVYCDSYDPSVDYWMTNVVDPTIRRAVSPRAIGGTFHTAHDDWKPLPGAGEPGRDYWAVDTLKAADDLVVEVVKGDAAETLPERTAIFCCDGDARRFIKRIRTAATALKEGVDVSVIRERELNG